MEISNLHQSLKELIESVPKAEEADVLNKLVSELKSSLHYLEQVDKPVAEEILQSLESTTNDSLFQEVGKLLRCFHDQLVLIREGIPEDLGKIASQEVVEMSEKLQMIITMTDKAANKTLDLAETIMDRVSAQRNTFDQIAADLTAALAESDATPALTKSLKKTIKQITELSTGSTDIENQLTEILIAQDYQDLTGQVIFRVIKLLKSLETDLAQLIDRFGQALTETDQAEETRLKGPLSQGEEDKSSQEDVDSLLTKFGF